MQLIMLSGNSLHNQAWIQEASQKLQDLSSSTFIQDYRHWHSGEPWIDLPHELEILQEQAGQFEPDYGIFAKSIGTVLATQALERRIINPRFLLLCGLPLGYITKGYPHMAAVLAGSGVPITIIHNEHDTVGDAGDVSRYLSPAFAGKPDYRFVASPGDTHDYTDYALLRAELAALIGNKARNVWGRVREE
jgi:hypothetical protein